MEGFHLLKSLLEFAQQYVLCILGNSQLPLYGTPQVHFFYYLDKITFTSSLNACLSFPSPHHQHTAFHLNSDSL